VKNKRALIIDSGGLRGAYAAGFTSELCRTLGCDYFDSVYGLSVGSTIAAFYVANQPDTIENTWRNHVDGDKLVSLKKILHKRQWLDLDYLISLFKNDTSRLDVSAIFRSRVKLFYPVCNCNTGKTTLLSPEEANIFDSVKAACAMPLFSHPVTIGIDKYFDGDIFSHFSLFLEEIIQNNDSVLYVSNVPRNFYRKSKWRRIKSMCFFIILKFYPKPLQVAFNIKKKEQVDIFKYEEFNKFEIVVPSKDNIMHNALDTNKYRLGIMIDLGKEDARKYCQNLDRTT
jgi:predicted patatin/cPLA2 family phospholipase